MSRNIEHLKVSKWYIRIAVIASPFLFISGGFWFLLSSYYETMAIDSINNKTLKFLLFGSIFISFPLLLYFCYSFAKSKKLHVPLLVAIGIVQMICMSSAIVMSANSLKEADRDLDFYNTEYEKWKRIEENQS